VLIDRPKLAACARITETVAGTPSELEPRALIKKTQRQTVGILEGELEGQGGVDALEGDIHQGHQVQVAELRAGQGLRCRSCASRISDNGMRPIP